MERFIKAGRISAYNMRMLTENIRIPAMIVIVFLFIVQNLSSVLLFSKSVDIPVTPYGFVFSCQRFYLSVCYDCGSCRDIQQCAF